MNICSNTFYTVSFCHSVGADISIHNVSKASSTVTAVVMPTTLSLPFLQHFLSSIFTLLTRRTYCHVSSSYVKVVAPLACASLRLIHWTTTFMIHTWELKCFGLLSVGLLFFMARPQDRDA